MQFLLICATWNILFLVHSLLSVPQLFLLGACIRPLFGFFVDCFSWATLCIQITTTNRQLAQAQTVQICPEMKVNEMHALYDKHHKVSSFLKSHQNTHNSVKYGVIWKWHFMMLIHREHWISLACISGHKWLSQRNFSGPSRNEPLESESQSVQNTLIMFYSTKHNKIPNSSGAQQNSSKAPDTNLKVHRG